MSCRGGSKLLIVLLLFECSVLNVHMGEKINSSMYFLVFFENVDHSVVTDEVIFNMGGGLVDQVSVYSTKGT